MSVLVISQVKKAVLFGVVLMLSHFLNEEGILVWCFTVVIAIFWCCTVVLVTFRMKESCFVWCFPAVIAIFRMKVLSCLVLFWSPGMLWHYNCDYIIDEVMSLIKGVADVYPHSYLTVVRVLSQEVSTFRVSFKGLCLCEYPCICACILLCASLLRMSMCVNVSFILLQIIGRIITCQTPHILHTKERESPSFV